VDTGTICDTAVIFLSILERESVCNRKCGKKGDAEASPFLFIIWV